MHVVWNTNNEDISDAQIFSQMDVLNEDGVVIEYKYFRTTGIVQSIYHKGRTTTHEIGHWLNLDHIWANGGNCGNDNVSDTPIQEEENYSCPSFPNNTK